MKNRSTALLLTVAFTCVFSVPSESQSFETFDPNYAEASVAYANPNCSAGTTEMLSLQPDGSIKTTDFVVAEPAKKEAKPNPIFVKDAPTTETAPVAVAVEVAVPMAALVPVSTPQYQPQPQVYSAPAPTYYPVAQPRARVCTSGG